MKYIDADLLRKEIEKRLKNIRDYMTGVGMKYKGPKYHKAQGKESAYDALLNILDSLQQEQQEVDIDEEIDKFMFAPFQNFERVSRHCLVDMGDGKEWVPVYDWKITTYKRADAHFLRKFARHFYELGKNSK